MSGRPIKQVKTLRPRRWRPALRARSLWPTLPGRTPSPLRACFACLPPQWASEDGSLHTPVRVGLSLTGLVGLLMRDMALTRDEVVGLMDGLLTSDEPPTGTTRLTDWLAENGDGLGRRYVSELRRNLRG